MSVAPLFLACYTKEVGLAHIFKSWVNALDPGPGRFIEQSDRINVAQPNNKAHMTVHLYILDHVISIF